MLVYNEKTRQYERDGVVITAVMLRELIDKLTTYTRLRARRLGQQLQDGKITPEQFAAGMTSLLAAAHVVAEAVGGRNDWGKVRDKVARQQGYLAKFVASVAAGTVISGISARAGSYISAIYTTFANGRFDERQQVEREMQVMLVQTSEEGCSECNADSDEWVPVSAMGEIGSRICGDFCRCFLVFEDESN